MYFLGHEDHITWSIQSTNQLELVIQHSQTRSLLNYREAFDNIMGRHGKNIDLDCMTEFFKRLHLDVDSSCIAFFHGYIIKYNVI